jgi:folate-dependent phosphoribosylglycinamide formyltransferase PurN
MKRIIILTGNELRHIFFKKFMSIQSSLDVIATFCESTTGNISNQVNNESQNSLRMEHLNGRRESEIDFFQSFCDETIDKSNSNYIERGDINLIDNVNTIIALNPDIIISYGCSIIKSDLLQIFKGKFINIHLGLSPYYRGSGTNFWPFVEDQLSLIGTTFMHIDEGIDTGGIIHQIRARICIGDSIHSVGNRLIQDSAKECIKLIENSEALNEIKDPNNKSIEGKLFRNKDFTEESIRQAYHNLDQKIEKYLDKKNILDNESPIINAFDL